MGIEPTQPAWKAGALPLSYARPISRNAASTQMRKTAVCCIRRAPLKRMLISTIPMKRKPTCGQGHQCPSPWCPLAGLGYWCPLVGLGYWCPLAALGMVGLGTGAHWWGVLMSAGGLGHGYPLVCLGTGALLECETLVT